MKRVFFILISSVLISCNSSSDYQSVAAEIDIRKDSFLNSFGIYAIGEEELIEVKTFDDFASQSLPEYQKFETRKEKRDVLGYFVEKIDSLSGVLSPPNMEYLNLYANGISQEEKESLVNSKQIFTMTVYGGHDEVYKEQSRFIQFIDSLISNKKYIVVDFGTFEYFNARTWKERRVKRIKDTVFNVVDQVLIKVLNVDSTHCRAITFGMDKFCLPDFSITDFSCEDSKKYTNLLMAVAQQVSERKSFGKDSTFQINLSKIKNDRWNTYFSKIDNAKNVAVTIKLRQTPPAYGDKNNLQYVITAPKDKEPLDIITDRLFIKEDAVNYISHSNEILAISKEARKQLPILKKLFKEQKLVENLLFVKVPFLTDDTNKEWMWVKVVEWNEGSIRGTLHNSSTKSSHLKEGILVSTKEEDVFDYIIKNEDGSFQGNETEKHMLAKESKKQ